MNVVFAALPHINDGGSFTLITGQINELQARVAALEMQVLAWHKNNPVSQRLATIPGIGPIIATAIAATVADANVFRNGRQFAAWLGLVPKQRSSGGRARLFGISKRGDRYLRTLMIHGARAALSRATGKQDPRSLWLGKMRQRRHPNVAAVTLANKNARIVWAMLTGA